MADAVIFGKKNSPALVASWRALATRTVHAG
jgi:hypothetical protein